MSGKRYLACGGKSTIGMCPYCGADSMGRKKPDRPPVAQVRALQEWAQQAERERDELRGENARIGVSVVRLQDAIRPLTQRLREAERERDALRQQLSEAQPEQNQLTLQAQRLWVLRESAEKECDEHKAALQAAQQQGARR